MLAPTPSQHFADRAAAPAAPAAADSQPQAPHRPRQGYTLLGAVLAVMIGWGVSGLGDAPPRGLLLRTAEGITVLDAEGETTASAVGAQVSPDGGVVVHTERSRPGRTRVVALDTATGVTRWSSTLDGDYTVRLVAEGGAAAVLGAPLREGVSPYVPEGRSHTRLALVTHTGAQEYELEGNLEPEAISRDALSVFVIQYTPAQAPESYQVRRLDLVAGKVVDVFTPDEELQQEMGGTARTQVASADGRRLYTLYTLTSGDGTHSSAFIHVLDLDEQWAHCIDLPAEFTGDGAATAMALSADGSRLYAADRAGGAVTAIDTGALQVVRTQPLPHGEEGDPVAASVSTSGDLFVSAGPRIDLFDAGTLQPVRSFKMPGPVAALESRDDGQLAVGLPSQVLWFDPVAAAVIDTLPWRDRSPIIGLGTSPGRAAEPREGIECAC